MSFAGAGAQNDPAVKYDADPVGVFAGGIVERIHQIGFAVGDFKIDGLLAAGQHDGLFAVLDKIAERSGGVGHGIGAVCQHKAVITIVFLPDGIRHHLPVLRVDIGTVQIAELAAVHPAECGNIGAVMQDLFGRQLRRQPAFGDLRGNGTTGAQHQYFFHGDPSFR